MISVQFGGAMAVLLLDAVGLSGSVALRLGLAALVLLAIVRPQILRRTRADWIVVSRFALALTVMNMAFYASLERLPIGVAVTIEFLGPLTLATVLSRRIGDAAAVLAALVGVVLISEVATAPWESIDLLGVALAALAGACWAAYIITSGQTGARFEGLDGIAIAMAISVVALVPILGVSRALGQFDVSSLLDGRVLLLGLAVALLSSAVPYSLELAALRHLAAGVFGVLLSLEPAVAALAGLLILGQTLSTIQVGGMALVVFASILVLGRPVR
ncbi:MAG: EamA family transporter [Ornithinimicrobium sp.]